MKRLLAVLALLMAAQPALAQADAAAQKQILELMNRDRVARRLMPLEADAKLTEAAQQHAARMAQSRAISHQFFEEPSAAARIVATGLHVDLVGENVASSQNAAGAHAALMKSLAHRANILNPRFTHVGIGAFRDDHGDLYVTEDFSRKVAEYSVPQAESRLLDFIANLRRAAHARPLPLVVHPELEELACAMAHDDLISTVKVRALPGVSTTVVFTASDLTASPRPLSRLKDAPGTSLGIGVCYSASAPRVIPVYWAVVVTYF